MTTQSPEPSAGGPPHRGGLAAMAARLSFLETHRIDYARQVQWFMVVRVDNHEQAILR